MKYSGKKSEMTYGKSVLIGVGVTVLCIILGSMLLTTFVISGMVNEVKMDIAVIAILFVSIAIASTIVRVIKGEGSVSAILVLLSCIVVLTFLSNVIFLGGEFSGFLWKMGALVTGSTVAMLKKKYKTKKYRNVKNR